MQRKNGRVWAAVEAGLLAAMIVVGVWYIAGRCGTGSNDICAFAGVSHLWAGVLNTGVMLLAGALLAVMLWRIDYVFGLNGACNGDESEETGE